MPVIPEEIRELFNPSRTASDLERGLLAAGELITAAIGVNAWRNDEASKPLLMVLAVQSSANGLTKAADVAFNSETPHIPGSLRSILAADIGLVMNIGGRRVSETRPVLGKVLEIGGLAVGVGGLINFGLPSISGQVGAFFKGERKPWVKKLSNAWNIHAIPPDR